MLIKKFFITFWWLKGIKAIYLIFGPPPMVPAWHPTPAVLSGVPHYKLGDYNLRISEQMIRLLAD